ncbi:MAG: META domain-containing protein [Xanthomonadales bacterium]|nr:META domain-containing protein [Xanthomonadales bacterium]
MLLNQSFRLGAAATWMLTAAACAHQPAEAPLAAWPADSAWVLESSDVAGLESPTGSGIEIRFEDGRLAGNSGCNQFSGAAELGDAGAFKVGATVSTKRACIGEGAGREAAMFKALGSVNRAVSLGDDRIRLDLDGGGQMTFVRRGPEAE